MRPTAALLVLACLAGADSAEIGVPAIGADGCSRSAASAGAAVRAARAELAAIRLGEMETEVPPSTGQAIERVKDRIRGFVAARMACAPAGPEPEALAAAMTAEGGQARPDPAFPVADRHGERLSYEVLRVPRHPRMLAVVTTLAINCGSDSMLILYRHESGRWRETMVRRSPPYQEIKGGWEDLRFAVSPPDAQGRWFVATASTTPWCTSAWHGLPYELARPGPSPERPRVFFRDKSIIYLGDEADLTLRAERDSFELRHTGASIDPAVHNRRHLRRYSVRGETVRRVQPVAENVRDFVDEWIVSPWSEAKDWSAPDPALAGSHGRLHPDRYALLDEFASIRSCGGSLTQLEIGAPEGPGWFFLVRGSEAGPWRMERVARQAKAECSGADRFQRE